MGLDAPQALTFTGGTEPEAIIRAYEDELLAFRRDMHQHPELARQEHRATAALIARLQAAGLKPQALEPTGLTVEVGEGPLMVAFRGDLDALPVPQEPQVPWPSIVPGLSHACGHDVHTTVLLGVALTLAHLHTARPLGGRVRLIFQPAEEVTPGGALDCIRQGVLADVPRIFALHCDPQLPVGTIGTRVGAITSASDSLTVTVTGGGGHTSRPHLTEDVVYALASIATRLPVVLARRLDPRNGVSLVWGSIHAGTASNVIPSRGVVAGTLRCLERKAWHDAGALLPELIEHLAAPHAIEVQVEHVRGAPPAVNTAAEVKLLESAVGGELGRTALTGVPQSLGGEDFGWYLTRVPGAMIRLGTRPPNCANGGDLHRDNLVVDERAVTVGARVFVATALRALERETSVRQR